MLDRSTIDAASGAPPRAACSAQPTRVRYAVLAFSVGMAVILYLDRMAISVALPAMARDLDLEIKRVADAVAVFFWFYALFQIPAGWLGDCWGGRRALSLYVILWSLAIAGMGLASGLASLVATRALLGIGQAGAYATTASFLRRWIPFSGRGVANSAVSLGGRAGGVLAPAVTSLLMLAAGHLGMASGQWRPVFVLYALVGILWAAFFWRFYRDDPSEHPRCNAEEVALIRGDEPRETLATAQGAIPVRAIVSSSSLWFLSLANFFVNVGWILVGTLLPTFLIKVHTWTEVEAGIATSFVAGAGMAGCLAGGVATDVCVRRMGLAWGRKLPAVVSYAITAMLYLACYWIDDPRVIVVVLVAASFWGDFALGPMWATYQDIGGSWAGTVLGAANMCGNFGAAAAASAVPRLADAAGWPSTFLLSVAAYSIGSAAWLMVDARRKILPDIDEPTRGNRPPHESD